jgi:hypothetical protein
MSAEKRPGVNKERFQENLSPDLSEDGTVKLAAP